MKLKIEIMPKHQLVECTGHPLELLMELSAFFARNEDIRYLLKHAIELGDVADEHVTAGDKLNKETKGYREGSKIIEDFMKRYGGEDKKS
jgi:hypothetical protein